MSDAPDWLDQMMDRGVETLKPRKATGPREPKPKKRGNPERDAQKAVVKFLRMSGCIVAASVNEAPADASDPDARARYYMSRARAGVAKGWPDLTVITRNGRVFWVEMKAGKGRLSPAQVEMHADMKRRGCVVIVARGVEDLLAELGRAGIVLGSTLRMAVPVAPL